MNAAYAYLQIYKLFDGSTPVSFDCGRFCGKACCEGDSEAGMYLFPGEESVFKLLEPDWAEIEKSDFIYETSGVKKRVKILICKGECDRYQRPLACRIFPLTPYINADGELEIITDPRARAVCPLTEAVLENDLSPVFRRNVEKAFLTLTKNREVRDFLQSYSRMLDEYGIFM